MPKPIAGLHHVTAIASDGQRTIEFYTRIMGLRFVKRTINFDDPGTYHLYFGDDAGSPGTLLSFFCWPYAPPRAPGVGEVVATAFAVAPSSLSYWEKRLAESGRPTKRSVRFEQEVISFEDQDGLELEIVGHEEHSTSNASRSSDVPPEHALRGWFGLTLRQNRLEETAAVLTTMGFTKNREEGGRVRFQAPGHDPGQNIDVLISPEALIPFPPGRPYLGTGGVHHIAFRAADEPSQLDWRTILIAASLDVTPVLDRIYFQSIYFREPGGVLFEVATDTPGFHLDEPPESLGQKLMLPPWMESQRARVERLLPLFHLFTLTRRSGMGVKQDCV